MIQSDLDPILVISYNPFLMFWVTKPERIMIQSHLDRRGQTFSYVLGDQILVDHDTIGFGPHLGHLGQPFSYVLGDQI